MDMDSITFFFIFTVVVSSVNLHVHAY
jgi:hypothetical protein